MFLFIKNFSKYFFALSLLCFFCISCGTEYEQLKAQFFAKRYLEVIELASKGAHNERFREDIYTFCKEYGPTVYTKAFEQVARECLDPKTPLGLQHLTRLQTAVEDGISVGLPVSNAGLIYSKCNDLKLYALRDFLATQRTLGSQALNAGRPKQAVHYFQNYLLFQPDDVDIQDLLATSSRLAEVHLVISHFYSPSSTIGDALKKELSVFTKTKNSPLTLKTVTRIEGLQINDMIYDELFAYFNKHPQPFIILHREGDASIPSGAITLEGELESLVTDTENTPIRSLETGQLNYLYYENGIQRWGTESFEFPVYTLTYKIELKLSLNSTSDHQWVSTGEHTETRRYRSDEVFWVKPFSVIRVEYPPVYQALSNAVLPIDKNYACRAAVNDLVNHLSEKIIEEFK